MRPIHFFPIILAFTVLSCVSTGKYKAMQQQADKYDTLYTWSMQTLKTCQDVNNKLSKQKVTLQNQANDMELLLTATKENNTQLRKQLQSLSALSSAQAESISKSLDNIGAKDTYLQNLQAAVAHRDSVSLVLVLNLKAAIGGFGPGDVNIKVRNGFVYVDLSDKILFNSDSNGSGYLLTDKARTVLGRLASVLNNQPDLEFMVEGHTNGAVIHTDTAVVHSDSAMVHSDSAMVHADSAVAHIDSAVAHIDTAVAYATNVPSLQDSSTDNWDLSVRRATAVVRVLQNEYHVSPFRMTAAGRSEYLIVASNDTPEGRAANRLTRIVILPQTDQLLKVLEHGQRRE